MSTTDDVVEWLGPTMRISTHSPECPCNECEHYRLRSDIYFLRRDIQDLKRLIISGDKP